jgi:hypothetical protein
MSARKELAEAVTKVGNSAERQYARELRKSRGVPAAPLTTTKISN